MLMQSGQVASPLQLRRFLAASDKPSSGPGPLSGTGPPSAKGRKPCDERDESLWLLQSLLFD